MFWILLSKNLTEKTKTTKEFILFTSILCGPKAWLVSSLCDLELYVVS